MSPACEYYLLGGDQKQLAVYKGIEAENQCGTTGKYVYLYPSEYLTYGAGETANITTRPYDQWNGVKEYAIADHLGSSRVVINEWGQIKSETDYEPFGGVIANTEAPRKGFIDKETDKESDLGDYGFRKFDKKGGRFTSIDPWWEGFPSWSPYQYCFNNPVKLTDPNGKVPGIPMVTPLPMPVPIPIPGSRDLTIQDLKNLNNYVQREFANPLRQTISDSYKRTINWISHTILSEKTTVEDVLKDANPVPKPSGSIPKSKQYTKEGGPTQAEIDFGNLTDGKSDDIGGGKYRGKASDGSTVIIRPSSSGDVTVEIQPEKGKPTKIRYPAPIE